MGRGMFQADSGRVPVLRKVSGLGAAVHGVTDICSANVFSAGFLAVFRRRESNGPGTGLQEFPLDWWRTDRERDRTLPDGESGPFMTERGATLIRREAGGIWQPAGTAGCRPLRLRVGVRGEKGGFMQPVSPEAVLRMNGLPVLPPLQPSGERGPEGGAAANASRRLFRN